MDDSHSVGRGERQEDIMAVGGRQSVSWSGVFRASNKSLTRFLGMLLIPDPVAVVVGKQ